MKKLYSMMSAIMVIGILVFTACAQPAPGPTTPTPSPTTPQPTQPIELKFAHHNPPTGRTTVEFLDPWVKKVEEATNNRVKITTYPAESLCKITEEIDATKGGITDIGWGGCSVHPGAFPLSEVVDLPFLSLPEGKIDGRILSSAAVEGRVLWEVYEKTPEMQAEWSDFHVLFLHSSEPFFPATTDKPVRNMDDIKGLKLRSVGGRQADFLQFLGASPVQVPMPGIYEALEKGVIDGGLANWGMIGTRKLYELLDYWTEAPTSCLAFYMIMNLEKWNSIPPDVQEEITSVSGMYGAEFGSDRGWGNEVRDDVLATAQKEGQTLEKVSIDPGELERWREVAAKPVWEKWVADMNAKGLPGQKVLDETISALEKYRID